MKTGNNMPLVTFFMLVTNRDCIIADYAINSYRKIYNEKKRFGHTDFILYIYLNCISTENKNFYYDKWDALPFTALFDNTDKVAASKIKPAPGGMLLSPEGITRIYDDYAENYDALWTTELKKFNTPYIATVDADFEILNADFYFYLINRLANNPDLIAASSCAGETTIDPVYETYSNRYVYIHERNHTWFCIYKKEAFNTTSVSHYYFETIDNEGNCMVYDSAANFQNELRKQGLGFISAPGNYFTSYVHYGASSKNRSLTKKNISYYRQAFILSNKGLIARKNNSFLKIINGAARKTARMVFKKYLEAKHNERSTMIKKDETFV